MVTLFWYYRPEEATGIQSTDFQEVRYFILCVMCVCVCVCVCACAYVCTQYIKKQLITGSLNPTQDELLASQHYDDNTVACIEDKCFVLGIRQYCRYKSRACIIPVDSLQLQWNPSNQDSLK